MLKLAAAVGVEFEDCQPPSGGCVLKHGFDGLYLEGWDPAAFRRLCVETLMSIYTLKKMVQPPSGGCVLKQSLA